MRFIQGRYTRNLEQRDPICAWTNGIAQHQQLTSAQIVRGKLNPTDLALIVGMKARSPDVFSKYSVFHL